MDFKLELVLIPAGKFLMGTPEPKPVDEAGFQKQIVTGQALLAVSAVRRLRGTTTILGDVKPDTVAGAAWSRFPASAAASARRASAAEWPTTTRARSRRHTVAGLSR